MIAITRLATAPIVFDTRSATKLNIAPTMRPGVAIWSGLTNWGKKLFP